MHRFPVEKTRGLREVEDLGGRFEQLLGDADQIADKLIRRTAAGRKLVLKKQPYHQDHLVSDDETEEGWN